MQRINEMIIPLLDEESSTIIKGENGITTITFYKGDRAAATTALRARIKEIAHVNPWLAGRVVKNRQHKNLQLAYPIDPLSDEMIGRMFFDNPAGISISSDMGYEELFTAARAAIVQKGVKLVNKQDCITRLTVVPDMHAPEKGFALIFSISHVAADGYTYYRIFNQLFTKDPVEALVVKRKQAAANRVVDVVGQQSFKFFHSVPFILNLVKGAMFGKKTKCHAFYVAPEKISQAKSRINGNHAEGVEFVSTNDILSSSFAKATGSRLCIMAVNLRSWIKDIDSNDAGNYAGGLLFYDETCARPANIRKAFQAGLPISASGKPYPKFGEALSCRLSLISSWNDFQKSHDLDGCEQVLHLPLYDAKAAFPLDSAVVFKAKPEKLAVMYFTKTVEREKILSHCELGEPVSPRTFG